MTELGQKLFGIFQIEYAEHLQQIRSLLALLEAAGEGVGRPQMDEVFRRAHTLKGAARAVEIRPVEQLAHRLETLFSRIREGGVALNPEVAGVIHRALDATEDYMAGLAEGRIVDTSSTFESIGQLLGNPVAPQTAARNPPAPEVDPHTTLEPTTQTPAAAPKAPEQVLRVNSEMLDRFGRSARQLITETMAQATLNEQLREIELSLQDMERESQRIRAASTSSLRSLRNEPQFAPIIRYVDLMDQKLQRLVRHSMRARRLQQRNAWAVRSSCERIQQDLLIARMVPAETVFQGFHKMVRDLSREQRIETEFRMLGGDVRTDRMVAEALRDPVMHLLRNALSHGLETRQERISRGKPPTGSLTLRISSERRRLIVAVEDDGRGVNFDRVREVAVRRGLISAADLPSVSSEALGRLIFEPGFSTNASINDLAGRGMGLSVVYETVKRLQGDVELLRASGQGASASGTSVVLSVPLSISTSRLLLVSSNEQTFAIPLFGIMQLYRLTREQIETVQAKPVVSLGQRKLPLFPLSHLLKIGNQPLSKRTEWSVMLLQSGGKQAAVLVDTFLTECEAVIQELGIPSGLSGTVAGGVLQSDGRIAIVLNPASLVDACTRSAAPPLQAPSAAKDKPPQRILVVDDSITTRTLEKSILEACGYRVRVAVDGVEALEMLRVEQPDLVITDLEMPRMNGFGLLKQIKTDQGLSHIPVIIVSSVETEEERAKGLALGAGAYIVKRKFDQRKLLETIGQIL